MRSQPPAEGTQHSCAGPSALQLSTERTYCRWMDRLLPARVQAALAGVVATVITFALGWAVFLVAFLLMLLITGKAPVGLGHWTVAVVLWSCAAVVGSVAARRRWASGPADISVRDLTKWLAMVSAYAAVMAGFLMWQRMHEEQRFLAVFPREFATDRGDALLSAGYDACGWLQDQPWGRPEGPELSALTRRGDPIDGLPEGYLSQSSGGRLAGPPGATTSTRSTTTLSIRYAEWVDAQYPASLADEQALHIQASRAAWYNLCPLSRDIRRPINNDGGD